MSRGPGRVQRAILDLVAEEDVFGYPRDVTVHDVLERLRVAPSHESEGGNTYRRSSMVSARRAMNRLAANGTINLETGDATSSPWPMLIARARPLTDTERLQRDLASLQVWADALEAVACQWADEGKTESFVKAHAHLVATEREVALISERLECHNHNESSPDER